MRRCTWKGSHIHQAGTCGRRIDSGVDWRSGSSARSATQHKLFGARSDFMEPKVRVKLIGTDSNCWKFSSSLIFIGASSISRAVHLCVCVRRNLKLRDCGRAYISNCTECSASCVYLLEHQQVRCTSSSSRAEDRWYIQRREVVGVILPPNTAALGVCWNMPFIFRNSSWSQNDQKVVWVTETRELQVALSANSQRTLLSAAVAVQVIELLSSTLGALWPPNSAHTTARRKSLGGLDTLAGLTNRISKSLRNRVKKVHYLSTTQSHWSAPKLSKDSSFVTSWNA